MSLVVLGVRIIYWSRENISTSSKIIMDTVDASVVCELKSLAVLLSFRRLCHASVLTSPLLFLTQISKKQVVLVLSSALLELEHLKHVLLFVIRSTHTYPSIIVDYAVLLQRT